MKPLLAVIFSLAFLLFSFEPAGADDSAATTDTDAVTCRVLDQGTGEIKEEHMTFTNPEMARHCESGVIAFIVVDGDEIEKVPGDPPVPWNYAEQEGEN